MALRLCSIAGSGGGAGGAGVVIARPRGVVDEPGAGEFRGTVCLLAVKIAAAGLARIMPEVIGPVPVIWLHRRRIRPLRATRPSGPLEHWLLPTPAVELLVLPSPRERYRAADRILWAPLLRKAPAGAVQ